MTMKQQRKVVVVYVASQGVACNGRRGQEVHSHHFFCKQLHQW